MVTLKRERVKRPVWQKS